MKLLLSLISTEMIKLRRTLALWMVVIAPSIVVLLQSLIMLNQKEGIGYDADLWLMYSTNILSIWGIFMFPMFCCLVVALVYHYEHVNGGWQRIYTLPVPEWMILVSKQASAFYLLVLSSFFLFGLTIAGGWLTGYFHPAIDMPDDIPVAEMALRSVKVLGASLFVFAIQNWVSYRWSSLSVPIGTGIAGTFFALFATGWKYGYLYPWLLSLNSVFGNDGRDVTALIVGISGGLFVLLAMVVFRKRNS
ncbi:MAG: ABC transporter permease [Bacteroidetes bacterium]|nr:ABC transporter permease [Bacteroidota bacterium]